MNPPDESRSRARPMPPDERRAAIITATIPLIGANGTVVTTKQIAVASGIAEGTLFRVFPDKEAIIDAAIAQAFDPGDLIAQLRRIDQRLPLEDRLIEAVRALHVRLERVWALMSVLRMSGPPDEHQTHRPRQIQQQDMADTMAALEDLLRPDAHRLRIDLPSAARLLRTVTFAGGHPAINGGEPMSAEEIVALLLHGMSLPVPTPVAPPMSHPAGPPGHTPPPHPTLQRT